MICYFGASGKPLRACQQKVYQVDSISLSEQKSDLTAA
jgi:hypothetical protein